MAGCQVCFETYEENGEHLPRILPCAGLICEKCIQELLDGSHIDCPECGKRHPAKKGVQSFPQTVLPRSKKKPANVEKGSDNSQCKKHGKDPCINCKETFCSKAVISFLQNHCKVKEEADAEEEEFETLFSEIEDVSRNLRSYKTKILVTKGKLERKQAACFNKMKNRKKQIKKILPRKAKMTSILEKSFNEPMKLISDQMTQTSLAIDKEVTAIDKKLILLEGIKEITDITATHDDIQSSLNITTRIAENLRVYWAGEKKFNYLEYTSGQSTLLGLNISAAEEIKRLCGHVSQKQMHVKFSVEDDNDTSSEALSDDDGDIIQGLNGEQTQRSVTTPTIQKEIAQNDLIKIESDDEWPIEDRRTIELANDVENIEILSDSESEREEIRQVQGQPEIQAQSSEITEADEAEKEVSTIGTAHAHIAFVCSLSENSLIICGKDDNQWMLTKYSTQDFKILSNAPLSNLPDGMTEVTFAEQNCLAVSYMEQKKVEFHDVADLSNILTSYSMLGGVPGRLCTLSSFPFILLYEDRSNNLCEVKWLDCSTNPPKPATDTDIIHTQQEIIWDMCCTQKGDKQLLITTRGKNGISAYNIDSDQLQWSVNGKLVGAEAEVNAWGVATDGRGHLFICDYDNGCVQKFSSSGRLIGTVIRKGESGLGQPWSVICTNASSLIVAHVLDGQYYITKTDDTLDDEDIFQEDTIASNFQHEDEIDENSDEFADAILAANLAPDADGAPLGKVGQKDNPPRTRSEAPTPPQVEIPPTVENHQARLSPIRFPSADPGERPKSRDEDSKHRMAPTRSIKLFDTDMRTPPAVPAPQAPAEPTRGEETVIRLFDTDMRTPPQGVPPVPEPQPPTESSRSDEAFHESVEALPELVGYGTDESTGADDETTTQNSESIGPIQPPPESQTQLIVSGLEAGLSENVEERNNNNEKWVHLAPLQVPAQPTEVPQTAPINFGQEGNHLGSLKAPNDQQVPKLFDVSSIPLPPPVAAPDAANAWPTQMEVNSVNETQDVRIQNNTTSIDPIPPLFATPGANPKSIGQSPAAQEIIADLPVKPIAPVHMQLGDTTSHIESQRETSRIIVDGPAIKELSFISYMSVLADGSVVVAGKESGGRESWRIIRFSSQLDRVFTNTTLNIPPDGLTDIKLAGKHCIAVTYASTKEIDFHDVNNLNQIVLNFPVAPHRPGRLCQSSLSTLLYVDNSKATREVRWLDCSSIPPKLAVVSDGVAMTPRPKITRITLQADTYGISCAQNGDSQYLITTHGRKGISAYDTTKDRLDWSIARELPHLDKEIIASSVTSDAQSNLFVCDTNNSCVHVFSISGQYQGTLLKEGDQELGEPCRVHWCNRTSAVVVVHVDRDLYRIRKISATPEFLNSIKEKSTRILEQLGTSGNGASFSTVVHGCIAPLNVKEWIEASLMNKTLIAKFMAMVYG